MAENAQKSPLLDAERALAKQLAMLEGLQERLSTDIAEVDRHTGGHVREGASLARALVEVTSEIRQLERAGGKDAEEMSTAAKVELLVEVFPLLLPDEQKALLAKLRRMVRKT